MSKRPRSLTSPSRMMDFVGDRLFINRCIFRLAQNKFDWVQQEALKRLERKQDNYGALYSLALCYFYKKDSKSYFEYYSLLSEKHTLRTKHHLWFINGIIPFTLYEKKDYATSSSMCDILLSRINNKKVRILLEKYSCYAKHVLKDYRGVLAACEELKRLGYRDNFLEKYEKEARSQLGFT